jgi:GNAT superfamily N-acetyltransferase
MLIQENTVHARTIKSIGSYNMLTIRDARPSEAGRLAEIVIQSDAYQGMYINHAANQHIDPEYIESNHVRVGESKFGKIVAFYSLLVPGRGNRVGDAELDYMFVDNDQQKKKIGTALFNDALDTARAFHLKRIYIVAHPPSVGFYKKMGAMHVGDLPPLYPVAWWRPILLIEVPPRTTSHNID